MSLENPEVLPGRGWAILGHTARCWDQGQHFGTFRDQALFLTVPPTEQFSMQAASHQTSVHVYVGTRQLCENRDQKKVLCGRKPRSVVLCLKSSCASGALCRSSAGMQIDWLLGEDLWAWGCGNSSPHVR